MRRAIAEMQSLFSCLFALLLYSGQQGHDIMGCCPPLVDVKGSRRQRTRGVEWCVIESVQRMRSSDTAVNAYVQRMRGEAAVKACDI